MFGVNMTFISSSEVKKCILAAGGWRGGANAPLFGPLRDSHVDKQFCMYVETLPRRQTILYVRLDDFLGRAAAIRLFLRPEPLWPPSEHSEGAHPRQPRGSERKKGEALT